jgi:hypothetical protein
MFTFVSTGLVYSRVWMLQSQVQFDALLTMAQTQRRGVLAIEPGGSVNAVVDHITSCDSQGHRFRGRNSLSIPAPRGPFGAALSVA